MVKDEIKNTSSANIEVRVVEKGVLHMLLIEFAVHLGTGSLHEVVRYVKNTQVEHVPKLQHHLSGSGSETEYQQHLSVAR